MTPAELAALDLELLDLETALAARARCSHVHHGPHAHLADELDSLEAELDRRERRLPSGSRRLLTPAERRAGTRFADLEAELDARAERITGRLMAARAQIADELETLMAAAAAGELPYLPGQTGSRAIGELLRALDDPAMAPRVALGEAVRLELLDDLRPELEGAVLDGYTRAASEATSQGVPTAGLRGPRYADAELPIDDGVRRLSTAPRRHAQLLAVNRSHDLPLYDMTPDAVIGEVRRAVDDGADSTLRNEARPEVHRATGIGREQAAVELEPARIYASELLDGSTCGPCSLVDGREYANLADARRDYPNGRYVDCEGGERCRGTLVFVWPEADVTVDPPGPPWTPPPPPDPPAPTQIGPDLPPAPPGPPVALSREAARELEAEARRAARSAEAAAARAAERAELDELVADGWTAEQIADARRDLDTYRARARQQAAESARRAEDYLAQVQIDRLTSPPPITTRRDPTGRVTRSRGPGGEWDWFDQLSASEQSRLRRQWVNASATTGPDELAQVYREAFGDATTDAALARWLDLTRRADAGRAMARGRMPSRTAYGPLDPDDLLTDSPFDAETLFGDPVIGTRRILERYDDEAAAFAERAAADEALELAGPAPWDMPEDDYVFELELVQGIIADPDLVPLVDFDETLGRPRFDDDIEAEFARYGELVPPEFAALDLAPADLYRALVEWATRSGLKLPDIEAFSEGRGA